jgi:hypothetical protein
VRTITSLSSLLSIDEDQKAPTRRTFQTQSIEGSVADSHRRKASANEQKTEDKLDQDNIAGIASEINPEKYG